MLSIPAVCAAFGSGVNPRIEKVVTPSTMKVRPRTKHPIVRSIGWGKSTGTTRGFGGCIRGAYGFNLTTVSPSIMSVPASDPPIELAIKLSMPMSALPTILRAPLNPRPVRTPCIIREPPKTTESMKNKSSRWDG